MKALMRSILFIRFILFYFISLLLLLLHSQLVVLVKLDAIRFGLFAFCYKCDSHIVTNFRHHMNGAHDLPLFVAFMIRGMKKKAHKIPHHGK